MKKILKLLALYGVLYAINNLYYWNQPQYQQHPTEAFVYVKSLIKSDSAFAATLYYPSLLYKTIPKQTQSEKKDVSITLRKRVLSLMNAVRSIENPSGNPYIINRSGYMGNYQFGQECLKSIGIKLSPAKFRKNHSLFTEEKQNKAFIKNCLASKEALQKDINKYSGKRIKGIRMNETNIVTAGHCGVGRVSLFLRSHGRIDKRDGNGLPVSHYLKKFENHHINFKKALTVL